MSTMPQFSFLWSENQPITLKANTASIGDGLPYLAYPTLSFESLFLCKPIKLATSSLISSYPISVIGQTSMLHRIHYLPGMFGLIIL